MIKKPVMRAEDVAARIHPGSTVMVGGFGLVGQPLEFVEALVARGVTGLTVISNNLGEAGRGLGKLLLAGGVRRAIGSYFTSNPDVGRAVEQGTLEVSVLPQGDLAESIRCGGAGIPAFYSPAAVDTDLAGAAEVREFEGRRYVLVRALQADFALIRAASGDTYGNLTYAKTAQNFNPLMAMAAQHVFAWVDELAVGPLDPERVHTPGIFVDALAADVGDV